MSCDANLARMEAQLGDWKATLRHDQAEAFDEVAALIALFRDLRTAGSDRVAAIQMGLESAWREFTSSIGSCRKQAVKP